jgi:NTE family protein
VPSNSLGRLIARHTKFDDLEDAPIPLHVVATDLLSGIDRRFSSGPTVEAVLASAAIPAIFPPAIIDGKPYIDGGVVNNTPISHAIDLGATEIWVLPAGTSCGLDAAPTSPLAMALHSVSLLVHRRLERDIGEFEDDCTLHLLPPLCPVSVSPTDFDQARELIDRAYESSVQWLATDHAQCDVSLLAAHSHDVQARS